MLDSKIHRDTMSKMTTPDPAESDHQQRPIRVELSLRNSKGQSIEHLARLAGLEYRIHPWQPWAEFLEHTQEAVDVGLQVSFTESFNYVAIEQMLCGKPVIGSPAIRYLPEAWQANPDDPDEIADVLVGLIENYEVESERAVEVATQFAEWMNKEFVRVMGGSL